MRSPEVTQAVGAALTLASSLGLTAHDAIVLHSSNKLTLRLLPADVVARVAPADLLGSLGFEVELAGRLAAAGCPVAAPDPRVEPRAYEQDDLAVTLWTHHQPRSEASSPAAYAAALQHLHRGLREVNLTVQTPHVTDRIEAALRLLADRDRTPELADADRTLLEDTLRDRRPVVAAHQREQLLHGEPHPGNVLNTGAGPLVIDFETCCRGPVEFDLAHAPEAVAEHYPGLDHDLLRGCRTLMLAMVTTWRWDRDDRLPAGRRLAAEWLDQLRATPADLVIATHQSSPRYASPASRARVRLAPRPRRRRPASRAPTAR